MSQNLIQMNKGAEQHASEESAARKAWFKWAKEILGLKNGDDDYDGDFRQGSQIDRLRHANTRDELEAIKFDGDDLAVIEAISLILGQKKKPGHFERFTGEGPLRRIISSCFGEAKKHFRERLIERDEERAAEDNTRARNEQHARFYGDFRQYRATDDMGLEEEVLEDSADGPPPPRQWVQISRTRIDLLAVTRSKKDDDWGVYIKLRNMDGRDTYKSVPRSIITDLKGSVAGGLAGLGAAIVGKEIGRLPPFLLTTVTESADGYVSELPRFLAVPTTGWCQLTNGERVFVLPHTTKMSTALTSTELAVFQHADLHLQYGIAVAGTADEWREQIAVPFARNSNVILAVGQALAGPLMNFAGVPPGMFHIWCKSKYGKSLASAVGQSVYGPPLVPNETVPDPFGQSWLSTANAIGETMKVRSSLCAVFDEINQGEPKAIADAAYRMANGIDKARMGELKSRSTYCITGFSTGEKPMVVFLQENGQKVTEGMRTRIADVPAEVQPGSVFEEYSASEIPGLGEKYYSLFSRLHGALGAEWISRVVDLVNQDQDEFRATISRHRRGFLARPKMRSLYDAAEPWQRSVMDRFATVAAACRMAIDNGMLPWAVEDTDIGIERCVERWAGAVDADAVVPVTGSSAAIDIVAAIVAFMGEWQLWEGSATELAAALGGVSADSLGRWLGKEYAQRELRKAGFEIVKFKETDIDRGRRIRIGRIKAE
jgi:hypothetical protein